MILKNTTSIFTHGALLFAGIFAAQQATAATVVTTYTSGDLFLGLRQNGVANTLAVDLGQAAQFIPSTIPGGLWNNSPFKVNFGVIPGTVTAVNNLRADLEATFGATWATNDSTNSSLDVSWAVVGITNNTTDDSPIVGLKSRSGFLTIPRANPNVVATAPLNFDNDGLALNFNSFARGATGNAYRGRASTENSSKAYIGAASDPNNWGTGIGPLGSTFNSGVLGEQLLTGANSGPTNSFLDLYLFPTAGSTSATSPTYLGTFTLNANGELNYSSVPEPGSAALLAGTVAFFAFWRRRGNSLELARD